MPLMWKPFPHFAISELKAFCDFPENMECQEVWNKGGCVG